MPHKCDLGVEIGARQDALTSYLLKCMGNHVVAEALSKYAYYIANAVMRSVKAAVDPASSAHSQIPS